MSGKCFLSPLRKVGGEQVWLQLFALKVQMGFSQNLLINVPLLPASPYGYCEAHSRKIPRVQFPLLISLFSIFLQTRKQLLERKYLNSILKPIYLLEAKKNYKWQFSRTFLYFFQKQQNIDFRILSSSKSKNTKISKTDRKY